MPPREEELVGHLHDERVAARLGLALGIAFGICFLTGLISHAIQQPPWWFTWPTRPVNLYRVTQGVHVITGIASIPLLLAKLATVYPRLFTWPPVRSAPHALERLSVLVLVGAAFFELITGLLNIAHWYPWGFFFPTAHYAVAWIAVGAIVVHIAVKLPVIRRALGERVDDRDDANDSPDGPSRRLFLAGVGAGVVAVVVATAGATVPWLRRVSVLAVRTGEGPQGIPVNKSAVAAGVVDTASDSGFRLEVAGPDAVISLSLDELRAMPQTTADLPIACVEGWSASATWRGIRVRDLVKRVGGSPDQDVRFVSLQESGLYGQSLLPALHARDDLSLLALEINGEVLDLDHGYPCRLITPSRPGVLQTKWVRRIEVVA
ncbi:MAG TPA: molybdopterin-dependent oxidoreductase [Actinomycetes bacterium]|nr:molybdopterin-dependent oxidoreductase [Actinomycetes bacterium]